MCIAQLYYDQVLPSVPEYGYLALEKVHYHAERQDKNSENALLRI